MKILRVRVPGRFEDAFLYRGHLLALTEERSLRTYLLEDIARDLARQYPTYLSVLRAMLAHNDWLVDEQFGAWMSQSEEARGFLSLFDTNGTAEFGMENISLIASHEYDLQIDARVILDLTLYKYRMYIGADTGLYSSVVFLDESHAPSLSRPVRRHDAACLKADAHFSTVNASCGAEGLFVSIEQFDDRLSESHFLPGHRLNGFKKVAERSLRTAWYDYSIVNYPSQKEPQLIRTKHERLSRRSVRTNTLLTGIVPGEISLQDLLADVYQRHRIDRDSIVYTYNYSHSLLVQTVSGEFFRVTTKQSTDDIPHGTKVHECRALRSRILSVETLKGDQVIETEHAVYLFTRGELHPLVTRDVLTVRTFGRSKGYRNMILITTEDAILLFSVLDDSRYIS